jgi:predicted transposase/invertase (TIGR01784 family)
MQFVDIKNDIAFRKIFGNEKKTGILISFLNAVLRLEGTKRIAVIALLNPFQLPILPNLKASIIDVKATDFRGNTFIVEMQVADLAGMDKRMLYYMSKEYSQQIISGDKYTELNPVVFIGIFDFKFTKGQDYYSHHAICNLKTKERVIKDMDFYFIELRKFTKSVQELTNVMDKWIYFIKEAENLDVIPANLDDEGLEDAYTDANKSTWTKAELDAYNYAAMREQDERGRVEKATQDAKNDKVVEFILEMHAEELPIAQIAKIAKLTIEQVTEIIENGGQ